MTIRTVLPRIQIRKEDQKEGQYPTVARTGDKQRSGTSKKFFDDTKTVVYQSNVTISYPTTYQLGSSRIETDLSSTIQATGNVIPNASEQFNAYRPILIERPFAEGSSDLEQSSTDPFFLTGTSLSDLGYYFNSKLADKTKIVIEVPITSEFRMLSQSVGCYYYNKDTKTFEIKKESLGEVFPSDFFTYTSQISPEATIFDPFGKYSIKIEPVNFGDLGSIGAAPAFTNNRFFSNPSSSFLASGSSNPTASNLISMVDYLNQPFLVEKAVLELPFEAGPGWLTDQTKYGVTTDTGMTIRPVYDVGGPAITFGLLNYHGGDIKSLIMSGSLIPSFDATAYLSQSYIRQLPGNTGSFYTHPAGFQFFGRAAGTVNSTTFFTGTAVFKMISQATSGFRSVDTVPFKNYNVYKGFASSRVQGVDIIGRTKHGDINNVVGRSLYGKDLSIPVYDKINQNNTQPTRIDLWQTSTYVAGHTTVVQYQIEKYTNSPYLLYPKDNVFLSLSKYRPTWHSSSEVSVAPIGGVYYPELGACFYPSKSHDVKIATGTLRLTLYGSLVKEDKEFHDTINQQLDSAEIHEFVGAEPIVDQFDLFYSQEFSGSYIDRFKMGSYFSINSMTGSNSRNKLFSNFVPNTTTSNEFVDGTLDWVRTRKNNEYMQNYKNINLHSSNERYYDSMHPKLSGIIDRYDNLADSGNSGLITFDGSGNPQFKLMNSSYIMGYLFDYPIDRALNEFDSYSIDSDVENQLSEITLPFRRFVIQAYNYPINVQWKNYSTGTPLGDDDEVRKIIFGYCRSHAINGDGDGITSMQKGRRIINSQDAVGSNIAGWKYGLMSALPKFSNCVFRRDRFGQPRDMLEQRIDTKFYDTLGIQEDGSLGGITGPKSGPVYVKFVDSSGNITDPNRTWSSNLSNEVTSSLPFFDGEARNREEPINTSLLNSFNVVVI